MAVIVKYDGDWEAGWPVGCGAVRARPVDLVIIALTIVALDKDSQLQSREPRASRSLGVV